MHGCNDTKAQILQACRALFAPGQVTELRILGLGSGGRQHSGSGWFDNFETLAKTAANYDDHAAPEGIYVTLNPVHSACLARSNNGVKEWLKTTTSDRDILARNWLPIDIDPVRPAGVSSTDAELQLARDVARSLTSWLEAELQFPPGIRACSGNGIHLLYRIDLPNNDASKTLISRCLSALSARYSTEAVKVDTSNINAARIWKLYGTLARKGDPLADRPHRRSSLFTVGGRYPEFGQIACVPGIKLAELAALAPDAQSATPPAGRARPGQQRQAGASSPAISPDDDLGKYAVDLDAFIATHNIAVARVEPFDGTGLRYILQACVFDSSHTGTSASMGRSNAGAIWYKCQHDSCSGKAWRDVCQLFEGQPTAQQAQAAPAASGDGAGGGSGKPKAPKPKAPKPSNGDGKTAKPSKASEPDGDDPWGLASLMLDEEFTDADTGQIMLRRHRQTFYHYSIPRRRYVELSDDTMRVQVTRFLGGRVDKVTNRKVGDVINCLGAMVTVPADLDIPFVSRIDPETRCSSGDPVRYHRVTLKNGILDIDAVLAGHPVGQCMLNHSPDWFTVTSLPFAFPETDEQATCPKWLAFLHQTFSGDQERIALMQEAFGSCFLSRNVHEAFWLFHGTGRNGKSIILKALRSLLGDENVSSLSLEQLADRYLVGQLQHKIANVCGDMNALDSVQEGLLKTVVTGEPVTCDRKYKDSITFSPTARFFFATNSLPRFSDTTLGIWRRMKLVPFDFAIEEEAKDVDLFDKFKPELPGLFYWALQGMIRLVEQGRFTRSILCEEETRKYRLSCFPIFMFIEECTDLAPGYTVTVGDLWISYRHWCRACGLSKPKPVHQFIKDVQGFLGKQIQVRREARSQESRQIIHGLTVRHDAPNAESIRGLPIEGLYEGAV